MKIPMTKELEKILDRFDSQLNTNFGLVLLERCENKFVYKKEDTGTGDSLIFNLHATGILEICYINPVKPSIVGKEGEEMFDFLKRVL